MRLSRWVIVLSLIAVSLAAAPPFPTRAQSGQPLQVWLVPGDGGQLSQLEYRDAGQNVLASYTLTAGTYGWMFQGGGRIFSVNQNNISIFDPTMGKTTFYTPPGKALDTDALFYQLLRAAPAPSGQRYAYTVVMRPSDWEQPATSWVYVATPGGYDDQMVFQQEHESYLGVEPFGWSADGSTLLLHDMPQGIGGYILYWQYQNVRALNLSTGAITPLGNLDGYSSDLQYTAALDMNDSGILGLKVTQVSTGQSGSFPLPALNEHPLAGGDAVFSPANSRVAYQVARWDPEHEKFWTIVTTGSESRVVFEDEGARYGDIGGWLDENTLVVGGAFSAQSAIIDVNSGTLLREVPGGFLGYASGITSISGFAPPGIAYSQCPGAPPSRLMANARGRITYTDGSLTNVRSYASKQAEIAGTMPEGATFTVSSGPECVDGYAWWYVQFDNGPFGAVAEGDTQSYYLEPWQ